MANITPISSVPPGRVTGAEEVKARASSRAEAAPPRRAPDRVELSDVASYLSKLRNLPVRSELVESARQQIIDGTYETEAKIDGAIDELLKDLG